MSLMGFLGREGIARQMLSTALAVNVALAMAGCGSRVDINVPMESEELQERKVDSEAPKKTEEGQEGSRPEQKAASPTSESKEKESKDEEKTAVIGKFGQSFSENLAWVKFVQRPGSQERYGCIDKKGNVLFAFPNNNDEVNPTPFDNGYSFIFEGDGPKENGHLPSDCQTLVVVDTKGNKKTFRASELGDTTNAEKEERSFRAVGGGYFVLYRHQKADFDNNDYPWIYEVYDAGGNYIDYLKSSEGAWTVNYCGQGVFQFTCGYVGVNPVLFFASSDKFIQVDTSTDVVFVDGEDTAYLATGKDVEVAQAVGDEEWQDSLVSGLVFVTKEGEIFTGTVPEEVHPCGEAPCVSNGKLILRGNDTLYSYDVKDGTLSEMPEEYAQHNIYIDAINIMYHDDVCTTMARGADGEYYLCAYDTNWNRLFDPLDTPSTPERAYYSDGLMALLLRSDAGDRYPAVIDKKGTVVFSKNEGYFSQSSNGVITRSGTSGDGVPFEYYDTKGNKLFDSLNIEKMKMLSFE